MLFSHQLTKMLFALRKNNMTINLRCLCLVIVWLASLQLSGCASITGGTQQSISVETKKDASAVTGAECEIINGKGKWFISTPGSAQIQRSNDPLLITCNKSGFDTGRASVESIVRAGMAGNFIFGGFILYKKYFGKIEVDGYTSLIVSILFSTGMIITCIGIIAMYLRHLLLKTNQKPLFHVAEKSC